MKTRRVSFAQLVSTFLFIVLTATSHGFEYNIFGADNCFISPSKHGFQPPLLRCPLSLDKVSKASKFRIRLYTLPKQSASECHLAGSNNLSATAYRFSKFNKLSDKQRKNGGLIYEAKLSGNGLFISESEGETWSMQYEVQCKLSPTPFLHAYSVFSTGLRDTSQESWASY